MHIVYFHPDKHNGYGATKEGRLKLRLKEQDLDFSKVRTIEQGLTMQEASDRERELQLRDGYPPDDNPYTHMRHMQKLSLSPESRKKAVANTDYKAIVAKIDYKARNAKMDFKAINAYKKGIQPPQFNNAHLLRKAINVFTIERIGSPKYGFKWINKKFFKKFISQVEAAKELNIRQGCISNVITGRYNSIKGYTFEYA